MILYKPMPLLEANFFLANRADGTFIRDFFGERMSGINSSGSRMQQYADILMELESRLESSIETDEATLDILFKDYNNNHNKDVPSRYFAANLIVQNISFYYDYENCFDNLRAEKHTIRNSIANWITSSTEYDDKDDIGFDAFYNVVKDCGLSMDAKMRCLDIAVNYNDYVDMLEAALRPVAREFLRCAELIAPLLEQFASDYPEGTDEINTLYEASITTKARPDSVIIYPLVTYYRHNIVNFTKENGLYSAEGGIGVMNKLLRNDYIPQICDKDKLFTIMSALGGKSRFNIVMQLAGGPVYGREMAKMLGVAPATVSQHMATLIGVDLVKLEEEGARVYYSLNREGMRQFIDMQKRLFLNEG